MKKILLVFVSLFCLNAGTNLFAQFSADKYYTIACKPATSTFMVDKGTGRLLLGPQPTDNSFVWKFEPTGNADCYYVKNVQTGNYIQACPNSEQPATMGTAPVEYYVKGDASGAQAGPDFYRMTSTDRTPHDFSAGTIGLNRKGDNTAVQGFASVTGANQWSVWQIVEYEMPDPVEDPDNLVSLTGAAIGAGDDIYLYNIDKDIWLQNNDWNTAFWTTRAETGTRGIDISLSIYQGAWVMNPKFGFNQSINYDGYYLDTTQPVSKWDFTPTTRAGYQNVYQIKSGDTQLSVDDNNKLVANGDAKDWQIMTRAERIAQMEAATSAVDASWLIKSPDFANNDERFSAWTITNPVSGSQAVREGDASPSYSCNRILRVNKARGANVLQTIEGVPNGYYILSAQGAYSPSAFDLGPTNRRAWETGEMEIIAHLYMNEQTIDLPSIYSESRLSSESGFQKSIEGKDGEPTKFFPGGINQISRDIFEGYYKTGTIIVNVTDGTLTLGVTVDDKEKDEQGREWFVVDNFKLTYCKDLSSVLSEAIAEGEAFTGTTTAVLSQALADAIAAGKAALTSTDPNVIIAAAEAIKAALSAAQAVDTSTTPTRYDKDGVGYAVINGGDGFNTTTETYRQLLDNDAETKFGASSVANAWAVIISDQPVAVKQYSFVTAADTYDYPARNPSSWKLEGSNDNQTWTLIDERTDFDAYRIGGVNKEEFTIDVNGTETYQLFKFSATGLGNGFQMGEFWINEQAHTWGEPTETASTCTVQGKKVWECSDCHALKTEVLPLAEHTYENGVCTECGAKVSEPVLLANGQTNPYAIKFRHLNGVENDIDIEADWNTAAFDDSAWDELVMPIGSPGYDNGPRSGAKFNTFWFNEYNTYWFRRTFEVVNPNQIAALTLKLLHDDAVRVFLNGTEIFARIDNEPWTSGTNWLTIDVDPSQLVAGTNVVAIYIEQNYGGAYCDFSLEAQAQVAAPVVVGDALYATYVAPCDVDFTGSEVSAYAAQVHDTYVHLEPVTTVPAGTAVVVKADAAGTYTINSTTSASLGADNDLVATTEDIVADGTQYILAKKDAGVGFYKATTGSTIAAGKGYLVISGAGVKPFYGFDSDDATGIVDLNVNFNETIYNVAGQRIQKVQKGINIVNGKKIVR